MVAKRKKRVTSPSSARADGPVGVTGQLDRELAASALRKVASGEAPTAREQAALKRFERDQEEHRRWQYYQSIPKKHWRKMSGRQTKVINEQAALYKLPLGGSTVSLPDFVKAFHDFLADNARKLAADDDDLLQDNSSSAALEDYRRERAKLARLDRLEREGSLTPRDTAREGLGRIAAILRTAGDTLQRLHGAGAGEILYEALNDADQEIERLFGDS